MNLFCLVLNLSLFRDYFNLNDEIIQVLYNFSFWLIDFCTKNSIKLNYLKIIIIFESNFFETLQNTIKSSENHQHNHINIWDLITFYSNSIESNVILYLYRKIYIIPSEYLYISSISDYYLMI